MKKVNVQDQRGIFPPHETEQVVHTKLQAGHTTSQSSAYSSHPAMLPVHTKTQRVHTSIPYIPSTKLSVLEISNPMSKGNFSNFIKWNTKTINKTIQTAYTEPLTYEGTIPLFNIAISVYGLLGALIIGCIHAAQSPKFGSRLWVPELEHNWPVDIRTVRKTLMDLVKAKGVEYIGLDETGDYTKDVDNRAELLPQFGYRMARSFSEEGTNNCAMGVYIKVPPPRKIPKGRLVDMCILGRIASCKGGINSITNSGIAGLLGLSRRYVIKRVHLLETVGDIKRTMDGKRFVKGIKDGK